MNLKLLTGISLVLVSLIIGKITTITFILYFNNPMWRYASIIIYIISWPMIIVGAYICGVEGAEYLKRVYQYFSYKYYTENVMRYAGDMGRYAGDMAGGVGRYAVDTHNRYVKDFRVNMQRRREDKKDLNIEKEKTRRKVKRKGK